VVLSQFSPIGPAAVAPLNVSGRVRGLNVAVVDQINQAYDRFAQDFLQSQGAYFATQPTATADARQYFRSFIVQRVDLLSQELTNVFVQLPGGVRGGGPNGSALVQSYLRQRINGPGQSTLVRQLAGLGAQEAAARIPDPSVTGPAATLYTSSVLTTINASRAATLNASGYLLNSTFAKHRH
jgi:hypothetical protein